MIRAEWGPSEPEEMLDVIWREEGRGDERRGLREKDAETRPRGSMWKT